MEQTCSVRVHGDVWREREREDGIKQSKLCIVRVCITPKRKCSKSLSKQIRTDAWRSRLHGPYCTCTCCNYCTWSYRLQYECIITITVPPQRHLMTSISTCSLALHLAVRAAHLRLDTYKGVCHLQCILTAVACAFILPSAASHTREPT